MKTLWTPWRIEHVTAMTNKRSVCFFDPEGDNCSDINQLLLYRDSQVIVFLNRFPYSNGHLLVAPRKHVPDLADLPSTNCMAIMAMIRESCRILRTHFQPDGFNIGCNIGSEAGAGISDHIHFHIVPRWHGDHNFMTVLADVRTIPEHIISTFNRISPDFLDLYLNNTHGSSK
jgi:ATP adenylyltransferase